MKVAVWDTYVRKKDGNIMHFDILAPDDIKDEQIIHTFGKEYLRLKNEEEQVLTSKECSFCHVEKATTEMETAIQKNGYFIIEMEGCN